MGNICCGISCIVYHISYIVYREVLNPVDFLGDPVEICSLFWAGGGHVRVTLRMYRYANKVLARKHGVLRVVLYANRGCNGNITQPQNSFPAGILRGRPFIETF